MTTKNQETKSQSNKTTSTATKLEKRTNTPLQHQEKSADEELEEFKANLFNKAQKEMSDLTGIFSSVARTLLFGIIGTIWVITYTGEGLDFPNCWLLSSLSICLFYFLVDVIHYFFSAMIYQNISKKAKECETFKQYNVQKKRTYKINRNTVIIIYIKFIVLIIAALTFCKGLFAMMIYQ